MYQLMVNRKNSKKGFTLVEVIVVLVILAILAAIMIPAMTGWIDEANQKKVFVEGRTALLAVQTKLSEQYVTTPPANDSNTLADDDALIAAAKTMAGVNGTITGVTYNKKAQVTKLVYTNGTAATYTYVDGVGKWA